MADITSERRPILPAALSVLELPFEILVDIFAMVDALDSWGTLGVAHGRGVAKLMLVCRYWRDMAYATPEFWRRIDVVEPLDRVSLLLERSGGCTIDVRIFYPWIRKYQPLCREAIALILPHAHRIRSLYINLHMDHYPAVYELLERDMPALEYLDLVPIRDLRSKGHYDRNYATCSLSRLKYPRLRSLVSQRLHVPHPMGFWRTLRTLKMYDFPRTASSEYLMRDVIAVLRANDGLEELVLWWYSGTPTALPLNYQESRSTPQASGRQLFALRNLRLLSLHGTYPCVTELLDHLLIPEDIPYVDMRVNITSGYAADIHEVAQMFGALIPAHLRFLQERMSNVSFTGPARTTYYTCCTPPYTHADPERAPERTAIAFNQYPGTPVPQSMSLGVRCLVGVLGYATVRCLSLTGLPPHAEDDSYERMFDAFPSLEELEVSGTNLTIRPELFTALSPASRADGGREVPRCPHLHVLVVHCARMSRRWTGPQVLELVEAIEECALARAETGVRLHKVVLHFWISAVTAALELEEPERVEDEESSSLREPLERMGGVVGVVEHDYSHGAAVCARCSSGY